MVLFAAQPDLLSHLQAELPVSCKKLELSLSQQVGLVVVDEVNGFCTVGAGNLAPTVPDQLISGMIEESAHLAKNFSERGWPILALLDTHEADKPEPPYPPHCIKGTGEENLVSELAWLENDKNTSILRKDCINGFIGGFQDDGSNVIVDWVSKHQIELIVVVGICTDICVLDFVLAMLSARNHGMLQPLQDVVIYKKACATYDLPLHVAKDVNGVPHPQDLTHHIGLYMSTLRGATVVDSIDFLQ